MELIKALERIRLNMKLTDGAFAEKLYIGRSTWQTYKNGRPYPVIFAQVAVEIFPQVRRVAADLFLPRNTRIAAKMLKSRRKESQPSRTSERQSA